MANRYFTSTMKSWLDRVVQFVGRRTITIESQSASQIIGTVTRNEGTVTTEGDVLDATNLNDLENRIDTAFTAVQTDIDGIHYYEELTTRDGDGVSCSVNDNSLTEGYLTVLVVNKQVVIHIGGKSGKTTTDWVIKMKAGYRPLKQEAFSYFLGTTQKVGEIHTDGLLYLNELNNTDTVSATVIFNIA